MIFSLFPVIGYVGTYSISKGELWPDPNWILYFFNYNGSITVFIGWFMTFAFADHVFVKFGLFDSADYHNK